VGLIVFNPLAGGLLTGKHRPGSEPEAEGRFGARLAATAETYRRRYWREEALQGIAGLKAFFDARGRSLTTAAVAWVLEQEGVTAAIVGASRAAQLEATLAAGDFRLDDEERAALDGLWYALPRQRPEPGPVR
jgi:aryl-alcohol dehydrogenase (NADP+)